MNMEELKKQLINLCNDSGLPLEAIFFVTKDLWRDVESTLREAQQRMKEQENKEEKE